MKPRTKMKAFVGILLIAALMVSMIGCNASKTADGASSSSPSSETTDSSESSVESISDVSSLTAIASSKVSSAVSKTSTAQLSSKAKMVSKASSTKPKTSSNSTKSVSVPKINATPSISSNSGDSKAEVAYKQKANGMIQSISASNTKFQSEISNISDGETAKTTAIAYFNSLEQNFQALGDLTPPSKYKEVQTYFRQASVQANTGLDKLRILVNNATESSDGDALKGQLTEGYTYFLFAMNSLNAGVSEIDKVDAASAK